MNDYERRLFALLKPTGPHTWLKNTMQLLTFAAQLGYIDARTYVNAKAELLRLIESRYQYA